MNGHVALVDSVEMQCMSEKLGYDGVWAKSITSSSVVCSLWKYRLPRQQPSPGGHTALLPSLPPPSHTCTTKYSKVLIWTSSTGERYKVDDESLTIIYLGRKCLSGSWRLKLLLAYWCIQCSTCLFAWHLRILAWMEHCWSRGSYDWAVCCSLCLALSHSNLASLSSVVSAASLSFAAISTFSAFVHLSLPRVEPSLVPLILLSSALVERLAPSLSLRFANLSCLFPRRSLPHVEPSPVLSCAVACFPYLPTVSGLFWK